MALTLAAHTFISGLSMFESAIKEHCCDISVLGYATISLPLFLEVGEMRHCHDIRVMPHLIVLHHTAVLC